MFTRLLTSTDNRIGRVTFHNMKAIVDYKLLFYLNILMYVNSMIVVCYGFGMM